MIRASLLSTKSKGETEEQRLNYFFSITVKSNINVVSRKPLCNNSFNSTYSSSSSQGMKKFDYDEYDDYDDKEPLTMKEKVNNVHHTILL